MEGKIFFVPRVLSGRDEVRSDRGMGGGGGKYGNEIKTIGVGFLKQTGSDTREFHSVGGAAAAAEVTY